MLSPAAERRNLRKHYRAQLLIALGSRLETLRDERGMSVLEARPYDRIALRHARFSTSTKHGGTLSEIVEHCSQVWIEAWMWETQP